MGHPRAGSAGGRAAQRLLGAAFPSVQRGWWGLNARRRAAQAGAWERLPHLKYAINARRVQRDWAAATGAAPATDAFVARHGLVVSAGPFAGLRYVPKTVVRVSFAAKLVGAYEAQLHSFIERLIAGRPATVINIGAAEGYYAVGMARRLPNARVVAFELDPWERRRCRALAAANGAAGRMTTLGRCTTPALKPHVDSRTAVLCDCEGAELDLLDPEAIPALRGAAVLVELHDLYGKPISTAVPGRFEATHDVQVIRSDSSRDPADYPALSTLEPGDRARVLDEYRPVEMAWALMLPRVGDGRSPVGD